MMMIGDMFFLEAPTLMHLISERSLSTFEKLENHEK